MKPRHWALVGVAAAIIILAALQIILAYSGAPSQALSNFFTVIQILLALAIAIPLTIYGAAAFARAVTGKGGPRKEEDRSIVQTLLALDMSLLGASVLVLFLAALVPRELDTLRYVMACVWVCTLVAWFVLAVITIFVGVVCAILGKD
jgi:hypothetical protein